MNNRAIIFQRSSVYRLTEREAESQRLSAYAARNGLMLVSIYVASGKPNMLTIDMLVDHCMAWAQPGHVIVADLDHLWIGDGLGIVIERLASAGAIVHPVRQDAP